MYISRRRKSKKHLWNKQVTEYLSNLNIFTWNLNWQQITEQVVSFMETFWDQLQFFILGKLMIYHLSSSENLYCSDFALQAYALYDK